MHAACRDAPGWALTLFLMLLAAAGCEREGLSDLDDADSVEGYGTSEGSITGNAILSANGKYGAGCALRAGQTWSVPFTVGAPLDNPALAVAKGNVACVLSLVSFRTGSGANALYTAATPITLGVGYASGVLFSSPSDSLSGNAKLSGVSFTSAFALTLMVSETAQTADAGARTRYAYDALVMADTPVSYWRLDDALPATLGTDDFTGSAGTLQGRSGWLKQVSSAADAYVTSAGRVRVGAIQKAVYLSQTTPPATDYAVSADVYVGSLLPNDAAGVIARSSTTADSYYFAGMVELSLIGIPLTRRFELWRFVGGLGISLAQYDDTSLAAGVTRRVSLEVVGSTLRASLDGTQRFAITDTTFATAGSAGLLVGLATGSLPSDSTGLQLDNFSMRGSNRMRDSKAVNDGLYIQGVSRIASGALTVPNGSASFDGVDDYIEVARQIGDNFSIELWFKSTQGLGASSVTWWQQTAGLVDAGAAISVTDFGIGLRGDGRIVAGTGRSTCILPLTCGDDDLNIVSTGSAYNDGNWHHVVFTRSKTAGAMTLYVDGAMSVTLASGGSTNTLDATATLSIGRTQNLKNFFAGQIDEVAVYASVLSAQAVLNHYQSGRF